MAAVAVAVAVVVVDAVAVVHVGDDSPHDSPSSKHGDAEVVQLAEEGVVLMLVVVAKTAKIHSQPAPHPPSQRISSVSPSKA